MFDWIKSFLDKDQLGTFRKYQRSEQTVESSFFSEMPFLVVEVIEKSRRNRSVCMCGYWSFLLFGRETDGGQTLRQYWMLILSTKSLQKQAVVFAEWIFSGIFVQEAVFVDLFGSYFSSTTVHQAIILLHWKRTFETEHSSPLFLSLLFCLYSPRKAYD